MINYVIGALILLILVPFYQLFGMGITNTNERHTYSFVVGFFAYTALTAIIGIPIQLLNGSWRIFFIAMIVLWIAIIGFIGWSFKHKRIVLTKAFFISYLKTVSILVLCSIVVLFITLQFPEFFWTNNLTDGGFYINRMANLPYLEHTVTTDVITGLPTNLLFSYAVNTFDLESSVYIYLSGISPTVYARFFLALMNIYIFLNIYSLCCEFLFNKWKLTTANFIYPCFGAGFYMLICICGARFIPEFYEGWRLASALYFGSTFCMAVAPLALLIPIINKDVKGVKEIIWIAVVCIVLVSRSTVCLPIIAIFALVYFFYKIVMLDKRWQIKAGLTAGYCIMLFAIAVVLTNANLIPFENNNLFMDTLHTPLSYFVFIAAAVGAYVLKDRNISILIWSILGCIIIVNLTPVLKNIIFLASQLDFVYQRMVITLFIFVYFIAVACIFCFAIQYIRNTKAQLAVSVVTLCVCFYSTCSIKGFTIHSVRDNFALYKHNIELIPWSTTALGNELEQYYDETGTTLYAMVPNGMGLDGYPHIISSIVRYNTPHTVVVSGALRISKDYVYEGNPFDGFTLEDQEKVEMLRNASDENSIEEAKEVLATYPFNCIVLVGSPNDSSQVMEQLGFYPVAVVKGVYVIYVK